MRPAHLQLYAHSSPKKAVAHHCCRYVSSASLETLGQAFKDATLLMQRNYDIFYEELKLSCYQPQVTYLRTALQASTVHQYTQCTAQP